MALGLGMDLDLDLDVDADMELESGNAFDSEFRSHPGLDSGDHQVTYSNHQSSFLRWNPNQTDEP